MSRENIQLACALALIVCLPWNSVKAEIATSCQNGVENGVLLNLTDPWGFIWAPDNLASYVPNSNCLWLLSPQVNGSSVQSISIKIIQMETESCCDYFAVYNGTTIDSPLVVQIYGTAMPAVVVEGETALLQLSSDGTVDRDGVAAFYWATEVEDEIPWDSLPCPFDCFGRGTCVKGTCVCDHGYLGGLCKNDDSKRIFERAI
ncbi:hypothetical protein BDK51DRAFT_28671 [Blyttiomyces helicus]|uniref:CUB domain-containing protein n=1 Tax=Blyttiomyces helicus TaxID=388810 RepID=A0A4P9WI60_9FUNG|nr:hypothetical protein BDK51DRAFT_28671 [Blyttiomyces helicus]|eukprot:RKO92549.1 hypothetical protein BDK51DRAFT_28671 [Blyttiomyces helicus]